MALGDINVYPQFKLGNMKATANISGLDLTAGNVKVAVMKNTWVPATNFVTDDFWADISANQVATATGYTGPIAIATPAAALSGNDSNFDGDDITIPQDAAGFADGRYIAIFYDSTVEATSALLGYGDLGADKSIVTSALQLNWNVDGILSW